MITYKRVCKVHKVVINKHLVPCEVKVIKKDGKVIEYCPLCKEEGINYGIKTVIFNEDK